MKNREGIIKLRELYFQKYKPLKQHLQDLKKTLEYRINNPKSIEDKIEASLMYSRISPELNSLIREGRIVSGCENANQINILIKELEERKLEHNIRN